MNIKKLTQKDRYGNMVSFEFDVPPMESIPHPGMPIGTDTVPAWLTPGERVMNAEAERMYGPVLKQMNDDGRALQRSQGGTIPEYAACGSKVKYKYQGGPVYAADGIPVTQGEGFIPFDQMPGFAHIRSPEAEGFRPDVYDDPIKGSAVPTVGYGHKLLPEEIEAVRKGKKYTQEELEQLYLQDYLRAQQDARENIPGFNEMTPEMQGAFTSQAFQLGGQGQADFDQMIAAIDAGDKGKAIQEVYNSDWAKQTPKRAEYLAKAIQEGSLQQAKSAVEGEMLADVEQERGRMIPTGYLNTDIFDKGGKFGSSGVPPVPQSGPQEEPTVLDQISNFFSRANEESGIGQIQKRNKELAEANRQRKKMVGDTSLAAASEDAGVPQQTFDDADVNTVFTSDIPKPPQSPQLGSYTQSEWEELLSMSSDNEAAEKNNARVKSEYQKYTESLEDTGVPTLSFEDWKTQTDNKIQDTEIVLKGDFEELINNEDAPYNLRKQAAEEMQRRFGIGSGSVVTNSNIERILTSPVAQKDNKLTEMVPDMGAFGQTTNVLSQSQQSELASKVAEQEKALSEKALAGEPVDADDVAQYKKDKQKLDSAQLSDKVSPALGDQAVEQVAATENIIPNVKENTVTSITEQTKGEKSPADNNVDPNAVVNKGEDIVKTDPEAASKVKSFLDEWGITDLFNKKEVGRMIATYLGSRALGYSHGGSLNFAAKNYMSGVDKINTVADKLVLENKHTKESIEEYRNTGDMSALITKPASPKRVSGKPQVYYTQDNKKQNLYEYEDANGNKYLGDGRGNPVKLDELHSNPSRVPGTDEFKKAQFDYKADAVKNYKSLEERFGSTDDGDPITKINPTTAAGDTAYWAALNQVPVERMSSLMESAYLDAVEHQKRTGEKVSDIRPFLNQQVLRTYTDSPNTFLAKGSTLEKPVYIDSKKLSNVNAVVARQLGVQYEDARVSDIANQYINAKEEEWYSLNQETIKDSNGNDIPNPNYNPKLFRQFENAANDDENGFLLFIQKDLGIDNGRKKN